MEDCVVLESSDVDRGNARGVGQGSGADVLEGGDDIVDDPGPVARGIQAIELINKIR